MAAVSPGNARPCMAIGRIPLPVPIVKRIACGYAPRLSLSGKHEARRNAFKAPPFPAWPCVFRVSVKNTGGKLEPSTLEPRLPRVRGKYAAGGFGPHETRAAFRVAVKIRSDRAIGGAFRTAFHP